MIETKKNNRGRPKKDFNRKHIRKTKNNSFSEKKIKTNKISTREKKQMVHKWLYIVGIFVIAIFIFSLLFDKYKNKVINEEYGKTIINNIPEGIDTTILQQEEINDIIGEESDDSLILPAGNTLSEDTIVATTSGIIINAIDDINKEINKDIIEKHIIEIFYQSLIGGEIDIANNMVDNYLKQTQTYKNYYNRNSIINFLNMIDKVSFKITNIQKLEDNINKPNNEYYRYNLSYNIKGESFTEERETIIVNKNGNKKIGSLQCINKGCSVMPFFNQGKYK